MKSSLSLWLRRSYRAHKRKKDFYRPYKKSTGTHSTPGTVMNINFGFTQYTATFTGKSQMITLHTATRMRYITDYNNNNLTTLEMCTFEYNDIPKVFTTYHARLISEAIVPIMSFDDCRISVIRGHYSVTMCFNAPRAMWSEVIVQNNVFQQYPHHYCTNITRDHSSATMCSNNELGSYYWTINSTMG